MADDTRFWSVLCWMCSTQLMCRVAMSSESIVLETNGSNNTHVVVSEGDPINIVCTSSNWTALNKGKITLDCPHNILNSTQIGRGKAIRLELRADRKMDGQHCTCAATSMDTKTPIQSLTTFHITYSANIASLNILNNVKTNDVNDVPEDVIVVIVCKTSGNPAPTTRLYFVTEKEKTLVNQSTTTQLEYQMTALCSRAGRYVCEAENKFSKDSNHTDLWIKCPPEHCRGQTSRPVYQVPVNQNFSIRLCVLYWPRHPLGSELRQVSADNSSVESSRLEHHVTILSRDMRQTTLNLTILSGPDHQLGEVNLTVEYDVGRFSSLYFKLIKKEEIKPGSMIIVAIVCPTVVVMLLIILVVSVVLWRKREKSDEKDIYQTIDEAVDKSSGNDKQTGNQKPNDPLKKQDSPIDALEHIYFCLEKVTDLKENTVEAELV